MDQSIRVRDLTIPESELQWRFDTGGGPGGQHANRNATRVELRWNIVSSPSLDEATRARLLRRLGRHVRHGELVVTAHDSRSQWANRQMARRRTSELIEEALRPVRTRKRTKPSRSARKARLEAKRRRSETKKMRRRPDWS